jgi:iron-sulfur cluster repair protein YtfE (RIC family)
MEITRTSVGEELRHAHAALLDDLADLQEAVHPSSRESMPALRARLAAAQDHIAEHFRCEEQGGYMEVVRKREPRLAHEIRLLEQEHRVLAESLAALVGQAAVIPAVNDAFREKLLAWIEQIRRHEKRENDLVQNAFNLDIGPED